MELSEVSGDAGSNYINASYIDVSEMPHGLATFSLRRFVAGHFHLPRIYALRSGPPLSWQSFRNIIRNSFKEAHDVTATNKEIAIIRKSR